MYPCDSWPLVTARCIWPPFLLALRLNSQGSVRIGRASAPGGVACLDRRAPALFLAGKQCVNLFQRHAPVGGDLDEMFLCLGDAVGLGYAEVMPDRVLDVLRVDSLVHPNCLRPPRTAM